MATCETQPEHYMLKCSFRNNPEPGTEPEPGPEQEPEPGPEQGRGEVLWERLRPQTAFLC